MDGEKIKFVYLKNPNPFQTNVFTFFTECPKELEVQKYIDYDKQFSKSFIEPMSSVMNAVGWQTERVSTLEDFFG